MVLHRDAKAEGAGAVSLAILGIGALLLTQLASMARTNFTGFDEWLIIQLVSKGIIDVPHGNRPVHLLWLLPVDIAPHTLTSYVVLHGIYAFLSGALVFLLCRRVLPKQRLLWLLTAIFAVVWGPGDLARLSTLERVGYTAFEFGMLLAIFLLVESWRLESISLLASASLVAFLVARSYEAPVPLLVCSPLLLLQMDLEPRRRFMTWVLAWEGVLAVAVTLIVLPQFVSADLMAYQLHVLGLDPRPAQVVLRLGRQYLYHLVPIVASPPSELAAPAVSLAVSVFAMLVAVWVRVARAPRGNQADRITYLSCMSAGLVWAGLAYSVLSLTPVGPTALRMQILSAPGIALFLASLVLLSSTAVRPEWRTAAVGVLGAWIIAVGTGRTVAMQKTWDRVSFYPAQMRMLRGITREVPDVSPGTLIVLLDEGKAWRATYGFRHAVLYLYSGRAIGYVRGAWDALYPTLFTPEGILVEPWPSLRQPWGARVTLSRYEETIVAKYASDGQIAVLREWPAELPPLPAGARYDPDARIVRGGSPPPEQAILRSGPEFGP
jgi:hypothetical protein